MTDNNDARTNLLSDPRLVLGAGLVAVSAAGFTGSCLLTSAFTDKVTIQLTVGLLGAVLFPAVRWWLIQTGDRAAEELPLSDLWSRILLIYGLGIILFPSGCPAAADVLQQNIPDVIYYAVGISGAVAMCVYIGMMWLRILKTYAGTESQTNHED